MESGTVTNQLILDSHPQLRIMHKMFSSHNYALCVLDLLGCCLGVSENWESHTGHAPQHYSNISIVNLIHPDDQQSFMQATQRARNVSRRQPITVQIRFQHASGTYYWYETMISCWQDNGQSMLVCVMHDISNNKQLEKKVEHARRGHSQSEYGRTAFLSYMNHELRTPLNAIIGLSEMIESQLFGEIGNKRYLEYAESIRKSGTALLAIFDDAAEASCLDKEEIPLYEEVTDITSLLLQARDAAFYDSLRRNVRMLNLVRQRELNALVDSRRLLRALESALCAVVASAQKRDTVILRAGLTLCGNIRISFAVDYATDTEDFGENHEYGLDGYIPGETCEHGIDMLSLLLMEKIIQSHGGKSTIRNLHGKGTRISITLPKERVTSGSSALLTAAI